MTDLELEESSNASNSGDSSPISPAFHGSITVAQVSSDSGVHVLRTVLSHRSFGSEPLSYFTRVPGPLRTTPPLAALGSNHVARNGSAGGGQPPASEESETVERRRPDEPLVDYIDRRLIEATVLVLPNRSRAYAFTKRAIDIVGSIVLLAVGLPVMAVLAFIIRIDSPGPALFRQERVTRGGRTFRFYKFRTMYVDAKERFPDLYAYDFADIGFADSYYKLADDPRNTRVGRWLRRTTLDELPNILNVLRGDLSLVGPRPDLPELIQYYRPEELACLFTKAGMTGLAQVAGRSLLTARQRLTLDVRYVAHQTILLDLRIAWRTLLVVLIGRGAF